MAEPSATRSTAIDEDGVPIPIGFERLPLEAYEDDLDKVTSYDGQIYLRGSDGETLVRVSPLEIIHAQYAGEEALMAVTATWRVVVECRDCRLSGETDRIAWRTLRCPHCLSRDIDIVEERRGLAGQRICETMAGKPLMFASAKRGGSHIWGKDPDADARTLIHAHYEHLRYDQGERGLNVLAMFGETLLDLYGERYGAESREAYNLLFPVGAVSQAAYREGGLRPPGMFALRCFLRAVDSAPDPRTRVIAQLSLGMMALETYQQGDPACLWYVMGPEARARILESLNAAIAYLATARHRDAKSLLANTEYCLAFLLLESSPSDDEVRRAHAIMQRLNLRRLQLPEHFGVSLRCRAGVECCLVRELEPPGPLWKETHQAFAKLLRESKPEYLGHRAAWYALAARVDRIVGGHMSQNAYRALFAYLKDENPRTSIARTEARGARMAPLLATAGRHFASADWWFEALSVFETFRAQALQATPDSLADRRKRIEAHNDRREPLFGLARIGLGGAHVTLHEEEMRRHGLDPLDFDDDYELEGLWDRMAAIFERHREAEVTLLSFEVDELERRDRVMVSAVISGPPREPPRDGHSTCWPIDRSVYEALLDARQFDRRSWREAKLQALIPRLREHLLAPIAALLAEFATPRVLVVAPARWGQLPLEAALPDVEGELAVTFNAPSLMLEVKAHAPAQPPRALIVAHEAEGLPGVAPDCERAAAAFKGACTVLRGEALNKRSLIEALREPYDHILIAAHAVADEIDPGRSKLLFRDQRYGDGFCLTAEDLVDYVRLPNAPSVLLAACSSGIVGSSRANDWSGLAGAFLRAGAKAVIASRWVVLDADASAFVDRFYGAFSPGKPNDALEAFVHAKRASALPNARLEDWAAFAYLGEA